MLNDSQKYHLISMIYKGSHELTVSTFLLLLADYEKTLSVKQAEIDTAIKELLQDFDEIDIIDQLEDEINYRYLLNPDLFYKSMLVMVYAALENTVVQIADRLAQIKLLKKNISNSISILGGNIDFLEHTVGINLNSGTYSWEEIELNRVLRNAIIHNGSRISKKTMQKLNPDQSMLLSQLQNDGALEIDLRNNEIKILKSDLVYKLLHQSENFIKTIANEIKNLT